MARRPSFQFYPNDWRANAKLRAATFSERGIWIEVMCLLHDSDEYGILRWELRQLAAAVPCHAGSLQSLATKRILKGAHAGETSEAIIYVDSVGRSHVVLAAQPGPIWFSSRMLVDEYKRSLAVINGKRGGNPALMDKGGDNPQGYPTTEDEDEEESSEKGEGAGRGLARELGVEHWLNPKNRSSMDRMVRIDGVDATRTAIRKAQAAGRAGNGVFTYAEMVLAGERARAELKGSKNFKIEEVQLRGNYDPE